MLRQALILHQGHHMLQPRGRPRVTACPSEAWRGEPGTVPRGCQKRLLARPADPGSRMPGDSRATADFGIQESRGRFQLHGVIYTVPLSA